MSYTQWREVYRETGNYGMKSLQNKMFCRSQLMSPPSNCYFGICIVPPHTPHSQTCACTHANCIQKITSPPCRCLKITSVPRHSTNHTLGISLFFSLPLLFPSLSPYLTILGFSLHFNLALNCRAWIALWTAWGGQAGRRCVWMRESLCYHHLFSFSSPSGAVRSQTRYHSPPALRLGVTT